MKSPWKSFAQMEPERQYLVLASSIPARAYSATWQLFRGSQIVRSQLGRTDGVVGFSMLARPIRKQYATLSVWTGEEALDRFAATEPHGALMARLAPLMGPTRFVRWTIAGHEGRPSWGDALDRLAGDG